MVADIGHANCRFGQAGQDAPRLVFRTDMGRLSEQGADRFIVGDSALRVLRENLDIVSPFNEGDIEWNAMESLLRYGLDSCLLHVDQRDYPLLLAENQFQTNSQKEKLIEMAFESFDIPALYSCHNATLSAFASGRPTGLIVDLGAAETRCTPIADGYALKRSIVASHRGGFYLDQVFAEALQKDFSSISSNDVRGKKRSRDGTQEQAPFPIMTPWYQCCGTSSKIDAFQTPTPSFQKMHCMDTLRDVRHWMCFIPTSRESSPGMSSQSAQSSTSEEHYDVGNIIASIPPYELPDGTRINSSPELTLVVEQHLFDPNFPSSSLNKSSGEVYNLLNKQKSSVNQHGEFSAHYDNKADLAGLVHQAALRADVDARKELLANVVVVGGGSLTDGVIPRLQSDLSRLLPAHIKTKVISSMLPIERHHSAWIGGSILGICGSFQQLWISREEYQEYGSIIHRQRCVH